MILRITNIRFCYAWYYDILLNIKKQEVIMDKKAFIKYLSALLLFGLNGIVASNIALSSYEIVFLRTLI